MASASPTNFYLAAAAVIPIMALAQAVQRSITLNATSTEGLAYLRRTLRRARVGNVIWTSLEGALFFWAEFICLRKLETGVAPFGGSTTVWVALAYGGLYLLSLRLGALVEEGDVHALVAWAEKYAVAQEHFRRSRRSTDSVEDQRVTSGKAEVPNGRE